MNSLDSVKTKLKNQLTEFSNKPFQTFKTEEEVQDVFIACFSKAMTMGMYSYDPTTGELAWYIGREHELDLFARVEDGKAQRVIANVVREMLEKDGWAKIIILPPVTGSNRILVKMQSDEIKAGVITGSIKLVKNILKKK